MKKKLFIHVGPHKTGTTFIQKTCLNNTEFLARKNYIYPKVFFNFLGHHELVDKVRNKNISDLDVENLKGTGKNIIFSSENFIGFSLANWLYFLDVFSDFDIKVIYSWRRSSLKMYSMWQESIKHGESKSFFSYYYEDLIKPGQSLFLSQIINLDLLAEVFGKENLYILDYDSLSEKSLLVEKFFSIIGFDVEDVEVRSEGEGIKNASMPSSFTEILRCLNAYDISLGNPKSIEMRLKFFQEKDALAELITQIEENMKESYFDLSFGDYFVDKVTDKKIIENYKDRVFSYEKKEATKLFSIVNENWLLKKDSLDLLITLYWQLKSERSN